MAALWHTQTQSTSVSATPPERYLRAEHLITRSGVKAGRLAEPTVTQLPDL